jgi:AcrR family transcriptional regulator
MTHASYLKEKARQLRTERKLTLDEIADRLALPRTTIYYWIRDMPRPERCLVRPGPAHRLGSRAMQLKYKRLRDDAYDLGLDEFDHFVREATFTEFVTLFIAEGHKRDRNSVSIANSDPTVIKIVNTWMLRLATKPLVYSVQYHADQDVDQIRVFWANFVGTEPSRIRLQRKSNSRQLAHRTWRSEHGVLTVTLHDTYLRSRMQAWVDQVKARWLDS